MTLCIFCNEEVLPTDLVSRDAIIDGQTGERMRPHAECSLRSVLGGIGHHKDHRFWCVQVRDPDGGHTYRESAKQVWEGYHNGTIRPEDAVVRDED